LLGVRLEWASIENVAPVLGNVKGPLALLGGDAALDVACAPGDLARIDARRSSTRAIAEITNALERSVRTRTVCVFRADRTQWSSYAWSRYTKILA
jgi:hypothetical protein